MRIQGFPKTDWLSKLGFAKMSGPFLEGTSSGLQHAIVEPI